MDPQDHETLYAATWQRTRQKWNDPRNDAATSGSGIWKTTDAGKTWTPINTGLPEARFRGRIGIDLCLTKPNVLYAFVDNYEKAREPSEEEQADSYGLPSAGIIKGATVYRSDDKGATWTPGERPDARAEDVHGAPLQHLRLGLRPDPRRPQRREHGLYHGPAAERLAGTAARRSAPGPARAAIITPCGSIPANSDYLVKGFDQGLAVSYDKGKNWRYFQKPDPGLPVLQRRLRHGHAVQGLRLDAGPRQLPGPGRPGRGRDRIPAQAFENAPGGEGSQSRHRSEQSRTSSIRPASTARSPGRNTTSPANAPGRPFSKTLLPRAVRERAAAARPVAGALHPLAAQPATSSTTACSSSSARVDRGDTWERISPDLTAPIPSEMGDIPYHTLFALSESPLQVRADLRRDRRRPGLGDPGRRQDLDRDSTPDCRTRNGFPGWSLPSTTWARST